MTNQVSLADYNQQNVGFRFIEVQVPVPELASLCTLTMSTCNNSELTWMIYSEKISNIYSELPYDAIKMDEDHVVT